VEFSIVQGVVRQFEGGFVKDSASYRRVGVYTKSSAKYKVERERRRKVRVLAEKGYTQKMIAGELGVSVRTVKRDWSKVRSYAKAEVKKKMRRELQRRYPGLGFDEAFERMKRDFKEYSDRVWVPQESLTVPEGRRGPPLEIVVTLFLDDLARDGFPRVRVSPAGNIRFVGDYDLRVIACKNGQERQLICLNCSRSRHGFR
jgi:hypothetical protein